MEYKRPTYSKEELKKYQKLVPSFGLTKSEALSYAAKMGASDSIRGLQQMGSELFGFDETVEELKKSDRKLQAILENPEYGNAALGTFLSSAIIADPVGWIPIFGTAKKAKNIFDFAKYGALAGGVHSGMGYVSEESPGLIGEKQSRLENTLLGVGAGATLGAIAPTTANAIQKLRGKDPIYGLTKDISYTTTEEVPVTVKRPKKETLSQQKDEFYAKQFEVPTLPKPRAEPLEPEKFLNFDDSKIISDPKTKNRLYKGFEIQKDIKSNTFLLFIPGEKFAEKSFKSLKKAIAHVDKFAIQNARRKIDLRRTNLNNPDLKLTDLQKAELQKSIDVGKSYQDRRVGQVTLKEEDLTQELENLQTTIKTARQQNRKFLKELRFGDRRIKPIDTSKTHRIADQKEYPFFIWRPDLPKSYRKGMRFRTFDDAKRYVFMQERKGLIDGNSKVEIHTGSPSKINRGLDSKTFRQAGTFKSFANEYENSRLTTIQRNNSYIKSGKTRIDAIQRQTRDEKLRLEVEAKGQGPGPTEEYYRGRFSNEPEYDEAIEYIVKEKTRTGSDKPTEMSPVLKFYQDYAGNTLKNFVFNNGGSSLLGFSTGLGTYNAQNKHDSTFTESFTTALLAGLGAGVGANKIGKFRLKNTDELISEKLGKMFIDDYGLTDSYKVLREELQFDQNSFALKFLKLAEEANTKLNQNERKIFYNLMTGELDDISALTEEGIDITNRARELIKKLGQEYVDEGLLDPEIFRKNAETYLHRSYIKSIKDPKYKKQLQTARKITLVGDNLRPRGDVREFTNATKYRRVAKRLQKEGYEVIEQQGSFAKPPKKKKGAKKKKDEQKEKFRIVLRKDFTKEERIKLGEIEDVAFAIAETGRLMSNDLATAKFFSKIREDENFFIKDKETFKALGSPEDFVPIPTEKIRGTSAFKFGKLAGEKGKPNPGFLKREVYDDITRMYRIKLQNEDKLFDDITEKFDGLQRYWKLSKTAWNPATHFNNFISNFLLLDFADTKVEMLVKAAKEFKLGDASELLQMATQRGIFDVDVTTRELKSITQEYGAKITDGSYSLGGEVAKGLEEITDGSDINQALSFSDKLWRGASKVKKATLGNLEKAYQFEDQVFRMAVFMDRLNKGASPEVAAREAKKWFIDYDINAPMINKLRRTVTPFLSYTYRVVPLLAEAAILRPHKFAKWAAIGYGLNEIGKQLGGGNEELERVTMRDELSKRVWGVPFMPPRMIKLPFKSNDGDAQYLDVSRLLPGGDIFEQREGEGFKLPLLPSPAQPGGLLVDIPLIMGTKKNPFTGQDIEGLGRRGMFGDSLPIIKAIAQNLTPNVAILPGSYAWKKMETAMATGEPFYSTPGSKYAAKYSPIEALAFTLGIKLRPQNIRANERLKQVDYNSKVQDLKKIRKGYINDYRNQKNIFSKKELDKKLAEIDLEILKLAAEFEVYRKEKAKARAKDVRLPKTTGGFVEGEEVPFTKENPAEAINPYTGEPYQVSEETRRSSLLNTLRDRVTRVQKAEGGQVKQEASTFLSKSDIVLKALKENISAERGEYYTDDEIKMLKNFANNVALVESDRNPSAIQVSKDGKAVGPGRGKYQYEISVNELDSTLVGSGANKTALQRYKNMHEVYKIPLSARDKEIIDQIDNNLDFSTLTEDEQDAIFYADKIMGKMPLSDFFSGSLSENDAWYLYHYAGKDETKRNKLNERLYNE